MSEVGGPRPPLASDPGSEPPGPLPMGDRITRAVQLGTLITMALLLAALVTDRLRPDDVVDRAGIVATPFLWTIVVWWAVLLLRAVAFEDPRTSGLERLPLMIAAAIGVLIFFAGLVLFDGGGVGRRLAYLLANSAGAVMFWWGVIGLGYLVVQKLERVT